MSHIESPPKGLNCVKAKFISVYLSIVLLLVISISGTMAYFTDTTEAGVNTIVAGTLDVELEYSTDEGVVWHPLTEESDILTYMPGIPRTVLIRIANKGNLSLKYECGTLVRNVILGENDHGGKIDLSDYLMVAVADAQHYQDDEAFRTALESAQPAQNMTCANVGSGLFAGELAPGASKVFRLAVWLPNSVGNEANYRVSTDPNFPDMYRPYIDLGLFVSATQATQESDSFGSDYDAAATVPTP